MKRKLSLLLAVVILMASISCTASAGGFFEAYKSMLKGAAKLGVTAWKDAIWDYGGDYMLSEVEWTLIELDESSSALYPELVAALEEINRQRTEDSRVLSEELSALAEDIYEDTDSPGYCSGSFDYYVQRADHAVLSFRSDSEIYWGGAHADYGTAGINLAPETGRELALSDVVVDTYVLTTLLARRLAEKYPDASFGDLETELLNFSEDEFEWTLGCEGITFYFSPYIIQPYAAGKTSATIRFDEAESLFNSEYIPGSTTAYAVELPWFEAVDCDIDPLDGKQDIIELTAVMGEYDDYEEIRIGINGVSFEENIYAYNLEAYLIIVGEGALRRSYLYLETVQENDYTTLHVYDLNGTEPFKVGEIFGCGFAGGLYSGKDVLTSPMDFRLETWMEIIGTRFGKADYSVDEKTGMPVRQTDHYELPDYGYPLTSLIPLQVLMLDTGCEQTIPAGTDFHEIRTDGESYMDFRLDDGRECRISVDTSGYPCLINGIDEYECFEGFVYAG